MELKGLLLLVFTSILHLQNPLNAQLNIKVGYGLSYFNAKENNQVLNRFNMAQNEVLNGNYVKPLSPVKVLNGIQLGLRYQFTDFQAFEFGWENQSVQKEALGETSTGGLFKQKLFYSSNQLYLGYHLLLDQWGGGIGLGINNFKIRDEIGESDVKKNIIDEDQTVLRFNLAYNFSPASRVSFSIQPFYHLSLDAIGLDPLESELGIEKTDTKSSFTHFGIRFIFYNGPKS